MDIDKEYILKTECFIDNFEDIKKYLSFKSNDDCYVIQILQRKKDNSEQTKQSITKDTFIIYSLEDLNKIKEKCINIATRYNARVYINLNKKSLKRIAFGTLKCISDYIFSEDYRSVKNAYNSIACSSGVVNSSDKRWIIDIDDIDDKDSVMEILNKNNVIVHGIVKTPNGCHIITSPFNIKDIIIPKYIDIHKSNPTVLWSMVNGK